MTKQYQSEAINDLAASLAKAQAAIKHAGKTVDNPFFKSKYADLAAVIDASREALTTNGLSVVQFTDFDEQGISLVTQINHSSGQWMRSWYPVRPVKNDPQGIGSAITYARRYAYSAITGVAATGEDDDGNAASGHPTQEPQQAPSIYQVEELRDLLVSDSLAAIKSATTLEAVKDVRREYQEKWNMISASKNAKDQKAWESIAVAYKAAMASFAKKTVESVKGAA